MTVLESPVTVDSAKLEGLRAQLPALRSTVYLNAGSNGPIPQLAHDAMLTQAEEDLRVGRGNLSFYKQGAINAAHLRDTMASVFKADVAEVAIMRSTTEGMNVALNGIEWRRGDEVITTQLEHICLYSILGIVSHRHGVTIRTVDIGNGGGDVVAQLEAAITSRTRVIAISHVMWNSGAVMPLREIADMARARGILTVIDAAQGGGQLDVDFHELGVDAYCVAGQKWLCGPNSAGILLLRADRLGDIRPTYLRYSQYDTAGFVLPMPGAARYEMGENFGPTIVSFDRTLEWLRDEVGFLWLAERNAALGRRAHERLGRIDNVTVSTPTANMAGMVCFNIEGWKPEAIAEELARRGLTIRFVDARPGPAVARVSTSWWCTGQEIDCFGDEVADLAANPPAPAAA